jgi:hypothetical protein
MAKQWLGSPFEEESWEGKPVNEPESWKVSTQLLN